MSSLTQTIGNMTFKSPIVAASGPVTDTVEKIKSLERAGVGAVSTKVTLFHQPIRGYRRMYAAPGLYNFNPSDIRNDFEAGVELVKRAREAVDIPLFANVAGRDDDLESWITIGRAMEEAGANALELNFFWPFPCG